MNFKIEFHGVKQILPHPKARKKPGIRDFWNKVFGRYAYPPCPICTADMRLEDIQMTAPITSVWGMGQRNPVRMVPQGSQEIHLAFICDDCNVRVEGWALDIHFDYTNAPRIGVTVEKFGISDVIYPKVKKNGKK